MVLLTLGVTAVACATARNPGSEPRKQPSATPHASSLAAPAESAQVVASAASGSSQALEPPAPVRMWPESNKRIPLELPRGKAEAWAPVVPPAVGGAPVSVFFHGFTANAQLECPVAWGAMQQGWVVCADGNLPYGGGFTWNNPGSKTRVEEAIAALAASHGDLVGPQRGLIIGYSIGAMAAWHLLEHSAESWIGLVFINAEFGVDAKVVKKRGLKRVAMVAARGDRATGQMSSTARNLARQGVEARFFSFESRNGHFFDDETWKRMMPALVWAMTGESG